MKLDDLLEHCKLSKEQLKQVCVDKHLVAISKFIGCWETCASHFELTPAEIEVIRVDGRNHEQRKLSMLQKWREKKAFLATFGALVGIFLKCDNALMAQNVCDVLKQDLVVTSSTEEISEQMLQCKIKTNEQCPMRQQSNQSNQSFQSQHSNLSNQSYRSQHSNQSYRSASFEKQSQYHDLDLKPEESVHKTGRWCISIDPRNNELGDLCSSLCHFLNKDEHALKNMKGGLVGLGFTSDEYMNAGDVCKLLGKLRRYFHHSDISFLQTVTGYSKNEEAIEMVKKYADSLKKYDDEKIPVDEETSGGEEIPADEDQMQPSAQEPRIKENPVPQQTSTDPNPAQQSDIDQPTVQVDLEQNVSPNFLEGVMKHLVCRLPCPLQATCAPSKPPVPVLTQPSRNSIPHRTEPPSGLIEFTAKVKSESITRSALQRLKSAVASTFCLDEHLLFLSRLTKSSILIHWHVSRSLVPHIESVQISPENEEKLNELHVSDIVLGGRCLYLNPVYYFNEEVRSSVGPIGVKYIATNEEFDVAIDEAGDRPIVMEFVARNHPATMRIAPHFAKLSMEQPNTIFLLVDRDHCEETADYFDVIEVPAFHFMKSGYVFPELRIGGPSASAEVLDVNVQEIADKPLGDKDPDNYVNVNCLIEETKSECFNTDHPLRDVLTKNKKQFLESGYDPDDEYEDNGKLILYFSFPEAIKVHSIQILGPSGGKAPQDVHFFVNQDIRSFDDIRRAGSPFAELCLNESDTTESDVNKPKILPSLPRFSNVRNLTVYVTSNQGGLPTTVVSYVGIFGELKEGIGATEISMVDFSKFAACEAYKCPRYDK